MSKMSSEEEEAVQAELEALQRETLVSTYDPPCLVSLRANVSLLCRSRRSPYHYRLSPWKNRRSQSRKVREV